MKRGKVGGDRSSLKYLQFKYGIEDGLRRFNERNEKISTSLKGKSSSMKGKKHTFESKNKTSNSVKNSQYHKNIRGKSFDDIYGSGSKEKLSEKMKGVFSLSWFIKKYGETEGKEKYNKRCKHISQTTYFKKLNKESKNNYSKISQELFWILYERLSLRVIPDVYFGELNHEFSCGTDSNFDFVIKHKKRVIEFNGNIWHANPKIFNENDTPNPYNNLTSKEIWSNDESKIKKAKEKGYRVLVIWEDEYKKEREKTINKCIQFLIWD